MFFPYAFTKHFQIKEAHEPSPIRVHVLCKTTMEKGIEMYRRGCLFMLCRPPTCDWGLVDVDEMLKGQVFDFAQCLRNETLIKAIIMDWRRMNVRCRMDLDKEGIRHMVVSCHVQVEDSFGFLCIHADEVMDAQMKVNGHYYWWLVCHDLLDNDKEESEIS